ncbi:MAG: glycosyltransferase family 52 [Lachnospiraceae bacterium]|nr:glycosyltransferase family 52 [Lachnospiraceae bacterium]
MKDRIYVCHTYYHAYIAALKELNLEKEQRGKATLVLSTMSNDFGNLKDRAKKSGLFEEVYMFEEKEDICFPELKKYHTDKGNIILNMINRIRYTKLLGKLQEPYVPVDFKQYRDIYVFCDSDPIGYYLSYKKIYYHAIEDGLDCISTYDTARYDNRGHFKLKAWMAAHNMIFIQNGYAKYCIDMEVNNISVLPYPIPKYIEKPREELTANLSDEDKRTLVSLFMENLSKLEEQLAACPKDKPRILLLTEPLCELNVREKIFRDIIRDYCLDGVVLIKPHPRDILDYKSVFPNQIVIEGKFPMEVLNFIPGLTFDKVISVFTVPNAIRFAGEIVYLGEDFMDRYEAPELHRQNEAI